MDEPEVKTVEEKTGEPSTADKKAQRNNRKELAEIRVRTQAANEAMKRARNERKELKSRLDILTAESGKDTPKKTGKKRQNKAAAESGQE